MEHTLLADGIEIKSKDRISIEVEIVENNQIKISSLDKIARELFLNGKSIKINLEVNQ